jgi:signal transduction histidine kinase
MLPTLALLRDAITEAGRDPFIQQSFEIASRSTERVLSLIESLLDISQLESGTMDLNLAATDLQKITEETITELLPLANEDEIEMIHDFPLTFPHLEIDQNLIRRVLNNLLDNALKFTPAGGQVKVTAKADDSDFVTVQVIDNGPGVPIEYREKVFTRFTQVPSTPGRRRGTGLGLTFCQLAVEAHGGRIWTETGEDGVGAVFSFTLPIAKQSINQLT